MSWPASYKEASLPSHFLIVGRLLAIRYNFLVIFAFCVLNLTVTFLFFFHCFMFQISEC